MCVNSKMHFDVKVCGETCFHRDTINVLNLSINMALYHLTLLSVCVCVYDTTASIPTSETESVNTDNHTGVEDKSPCCGPLWWVWQYYCYDNVIKRGWPPILTQWRAADGHSGCLTCSQCDSTNVAALDLKLAHLLFSPVKKLLSQSAG